MPKHVIYDQLILDAIDTESDTALDKARYSHERFTSEYGHEVARYGQDKAVINWLQGLAINIPYMNVEILELAVKTGRIPAKATEDQEDTELERYWPYMGGRLRALWAKHKVDE